MKNAAAWAAVALAVWPVVGFGQEAASVSAGGMTVSAERGGQRLTVSGGGAKGFHFSLALWEGVREGGAKVVDFEDALGKTKAIEISGAAGRELVWVHEGQPFVFARVDLKMAGDAPVNKVVALSADVDAEVGVDKLKLFTSAGLAPARKADTSYTFLALVDPATSAGVVSGWMTQERASGVVSATPGGKGVTLAGREEYGKLVIGDGETAAGEVFAVGSFDDAHVGLEKLADAIGRYNHIRLKAPISGYSTWYHAKATGTPGSSDEKHMAELADWAKANHLKDYGFDFLQIDDQWQVQRRDFTTNKKGEKAPYPSGMKATAEKITGDGFIAGLWLTPFGWQGRDFQDDKPNENKTALKGREDLFVKKEDGSVYWVRWAGDCLDMSNPKAREFLKDVIHRITQDWGYKLIKVDGLWAGMACKILYPDPQYRDEGLGDAVFHDPKKTNVEVYRDGLRLVREAAGEETFILGCNIAQNMRTLGGSIGLVDSMRIGPDINASWDRVVRCAKPAGWMYFLNGRVWWNDPDCLMLREPLTVDEGRAWGSFIAISGQLNLVSEWLPGLQAERLETFKRTIPNVPHLARPVDLFEREMPRIWHSSYGEGEGRRDIVGLFNWTDPNPKAGKRGAALEEPSETAGGAGKVADEAGPLVMDWSRASLERGKTYLAYDYWGDKLLDPVSGSSSQFDVKPGSCLVLALVEKKDRPQVLSTSRHVMQGLADLSEVKWDEGGKMLSGRSKVIAGEPYELRIPLNGWKAGEAKVSGGSAKVSQKMDREMLRVRIESAETGEVAWQVGFSK